MDNQKLSIRPQRGYGFVYCYISPCGKRYIGQTKTTLQERAKKNAKGYKGCKLFYEAIQKYGWDSFEVEILAEVPYDLLDNTELENIIYYKTTDSNYGYNTVTTQVSYCATLNHIPVYSYDGATGQFLERYDSISAAERAMGVHYGSIRRIINSDKHHVKGKLWRTDKLDSAPVVKNNIQPTSIKVCMYDSLSGDFLKEYDSIREAAKETTYDRSTIKNHIKKGVKGVRHTFRDFKVDNLYNESSTTIQ